MRESKLPLMTLLLVMMGSGVVFAGGWQYTGIGARAKGLGNAFRAISGDVGGAYYNPGGLAFLDGHIFSGTAELHGPRPEVDVNYNADGYGFGYLNGQTRYPRDMVYAMGTASLFFQFDALENVVFGGTIYQAYDHNAVMNLFQITRDYNPSRQIAESNHRSNLDLWTAQPTVAYKLADGKFGVGVGLQIHRADSWIDQVRLVDNPYPYPLNVRPMDKFPVLWTIDGYGYGVGVNVGFQFKVTDEITFGANYKTKSTITIDGDSEERLFLPRNEGVAALYDDDQTNRKPDELEIYETFREGPEFVVQSEFELDLVVPSEFGFGIAYQAGPRTLVAADFSLTRWSEFTDLAPVISNRDFSGSSHPAAPNTWRNLLADPLILTQWDDAIRISFGIERIVNERWTVRAGYMFDGSPIPDETFSQVFIDTGSKHSFNGGATFKLNDAISFEAAVEAVLSGSRTIDKVTDANGDGYWDNFSGEWKTKSFNSSWTLNYRF